MNRLNVISGHLAASAVPSSVQAAPTAALGQPGKKSPDDVVIVSALRTAIGRANKGNFKDTTPDVLLAAVLAGVLKQSGVKPDAIGDICVGNVQLGGAYAGPARMAMFPAGLPYTVPLSAVNRQCSSGLQAVANIASAIKAGFIDSGIGAGVESMTAGGGVSKDGKIEPPPVNLKAIMSNKYAKDCMIPMGVTSENVAERYGITRAQQDELAVVSHTRALQAQKAGRFKNEIVAVTTSFITPEGKKEITVTEDDGPRETTLEGLSKLKTVFKANGTTTAGTSSQVSDGAAAVLLMRRSKAEELKVPIIGSIKGFSVVGVEPDVMGIGPAEAIPAVLKQTGLTTKDIDIFELNEAFASQAVYCVKKLGLDMNKVNPNGGAIALGHPLGCTGARQIATLLSELHRTGKKLGVVSMCIGTGMGAAGVFEAE
jgi:acetyl-CoA acyltransferase 1